MSLSPKQNRRYWNLVDQAWVKHCSRNPELRVEDEIAKDKWRRAVMMAGMGIYSSTETKARKEYAKLMSLFEQVIGSSAHWTLRAEQPEAVRQIRFWIDAALKHLGYDWKYAQGVIEQMNFPGLDLDDLTLDQLHKVFEALDTHIRRHQPFEMFGDVKRFLEPDWKDAVRERTGKSFVAPRHRRAA